MPKIGVSITFLASEKISFKGAIFSGDIDGLLKEPQEPSENGSYAAKKPATVNFQFRKMPQKKNIIGHRVSALRQEQGLTQAMLAARCGMLGWDVAENVVTKIETQIRCVTDLELLCLAQALNVEPDRLLPPPQEIKKTVISSFRGMASGSSGA